MKLLGDIRYDQYPHVLRHWDVAWAPHRTGKYEVGGDLIKLYEYRAAGLPTVCTRVIGWERALDGVRMVDREHVVDAVKLLLSDQNPGGIPREPFDVPKEMWWRTKAEALVDDLGL